MKSTENHIGEKIKFFRLRAGLSQLDVELKMEASQGSVSRIETGEVNPTKETLWKLCEVLNITSTDAASLLGFDTKELANMIGISKKLNSTLDLDEILQCSVNDICFELKLAGACLFLIEDDLVYTKTVTQTWFTKICLDIVGIPIDTLRISLSNNKGNLIVKTINERKIYMSDDLTDYTTPQLTVRVTNMIRRITKIKSCIAFPLVDKEKVIGAMFFCKDYKSKFENEQPVLEAFTDHIAVAITNAQKYEKLQSELDLLKYKLNGLE
jgi:transcriptional regulator with XRE-family HTH domain